MVIIVFQTPDSSSFLTNRPFLKILLSFSVVVWFESFWIGSSPLHCMNPQVLYREKSIWPKTRHLCGHMNISELVLYCSYWPDENCVTALQIKSKQIYAMLNLIQTCVIICLESLFLCCQKMLECGTRKITISLSKMDALIIEDNQIILTLHHVRLSAWQVSFVQVRATCPRQQTWQSNISTI